MSCCLHAGGLRYADLCRCVLHRVSATVQLVDEDVEEEIEISAHAEPVRRSASNVSVMDMDDEATGFTSNTQPVNASAPRVSRSSALQRMNVPASQPAGAPSASARSSSNKRTSVDMSSRSPSGMPDRVVRARGTDNVHHRLSPSHLHQPPVFDHRRSVSSPVHMDTASRSSSQARSVPDRYAHHTPPAAAAASNPVRRSTSSLSQTVPSLQLQQGAAAVRNAMPASSPLERSSHQRDSAFYTSSSNRPRS